MKKSKFDSKDLYELTTKDEKLFGNIMQNSDDKTIFLKIKSGYNVAIQNNNIKTIKLIEKSEKRCENFRRNCAGCHHLFAGCVSWQTYRRGHE